MSNSVDAMNDLARIVQASGRLMATIHRSGALTDPDGEINHIQANLTHVRDLLKEEAQR